MQQRIANLDPALIDSWDAVMRAQTDTSLGTLADQLNADLDSAQNRLR